MTVPEVEILNDLYDAEEWDALSELVREEVYMEKVMRAKEIELAGREAGSSAAPTHGEGE